MSENRVQDYMTSGMEQAAEQIRENPVNSALIVLGLGVATGLVSAALFCQSGQSRQEKLVEGIGQRLMSTISSVIPSRFS